MHSMVGCLCTILELFRVGLQYMTLTPAQIGALRALGVSIILMVVTWLASVSNVSIFVSGPVATVISMLALSVEHYLSDGKNTALFGAVYKE